jgi:hypothetical protein
MTPDSDPTRQGPWHIAATHPDVNAFYSFDSVSNIFIGALLKIVGPISIRPS